MITVLTALCVIGLVFLAGFVYWTWLSRTWTLPENADAVYTVLTPDLWRIKLFRYRSGSGAGEPVLLCHGLSANHWNMAVPIGQSLIDSLVKAGYDCWAIDLRGCRSSQTPYARNAQSVTVDDYLFQDLPAALAVIQQVSGHSQVHWIGHSMGGMLLYAYEQVFGRDGLAAAVTLGSPPGFPNVRLLNQHVLLFLQRHARPLLAVITRGCAPLLDYARPQLKLLPINWSNLNPRIKGIHFFNMFDPAPGRIATELHRWGATGTWRMRNGELDIQAGLNKLQTPLLAIFGIRDPLIPRASADSFFQELPSQDKQLLILSKRNGHTDDYNHIDLAFSREAEQEVYAPIVDWLRQHPIRKKVPKPPARPLRYWVEELVHDLSRGPDPATEAPVPPRPKLRRTVASAASKKAVKPRAKSTPSTTKTSGKQRPARAKSHRRKQS